MGRQWLLAKREVNSLRKSQATGKYLKEIMVAAKHGGPDPTGNARLFAAVEKAQRESVPRDNIERAIKKGAGIGGEKMTMETMAFEGYAPHKVPIIVEALTDNHNRTAPEIRVLFKKGQLGNAGSNKFLFDHVGLIEAHHPDAAADIEAAAIEAGANEVEPLDHGQNDDIPEGFRGRALYYRPHRVACRVAVAFAERLDGGHERNGLYPEECPAIDARAARGGGGIPPAPRRP